MSSLILAPKDSKAVDVTREDQEMMCEYGVIVMERPQIKARLDTLKKELDGLEDADEPLMLADEDDPDALKLYIGDGFVSVSSEEATAYVEKKTADVKAQIAELQAKADELDSRRTELRKSLHKRLGDSVRLDEDD